MRGFWVGALSPWCYCPHESGGTLPLLRDAAQPLRLTPRMAGVATVHPLLLDNSRETSTEKRQKREEGGSKKKKDRPDAPPASWNVTPAACENRQEKVGLRGTLACWHSGLSGCGTGSCLLFTDTEGSDLAGSCLALRPLTTLGPLWPSGL